MKNKDITYLCARYPSCKRCPRDKKCEFEIKLENDKRKDKKVKQSL